MYAIGFFFFKQKTAYEMRISDWSSDVCSSDLLRLNDVEKLRVVLQKIANAYAKELAPLDRAEKDAITQLNDALGTPQLTKTSILAATNPHRQTLAVPPLDELTANTSLHAGLATAPGANPPPAGPKAPAP